MGTKLRFWHVPLLGVVSAITVLTLALLHPLLASTPFVAFSAGPKALFDAGLFSFLTSSAGLLTFFVITLPLFGVAYLQRCLIFLNEDEQCLLEGLTTNTVINGPAVTFLPPIFKKRSFRKGTPLGPLDYVVVKDSRTGDRRVEVGVTDANANDGAGKMLFLGAYDEILRDINHPSARLVRRVVCLKATEYIRLLDEKTGNIRVECGAGLSSGSAASKTATSENRVIPAAFEVPLDKPSASQFPDGVRTATDLKSYEFVRIQNKRTGITRVVSGPRLVVLGAFDQVMDGGKRRGTELDAETAVLIRNLGTGAQKLITASVLDQAGATNGATGADNTGAEEDVQFNGDFVLPQTKAKSKSSGSQIFIPGPLVEIIEVRKLIKLADYEACIVRGKDGGDKFYFGSNPQERSFFLPPYSELVELKWSRGRRRERRDLIISKIDLRPMYMSFEFNCRTADNVELILEGSFFWEVVDLKAMVKFTGDTSGDVCNHARSKFIERVSKVTLQEFMGNFNKIAEAVFREDAAVRVSIGAGATTEPGSPGSPARLSQKKSSPAAMAAGIPEGANFYQQRGVLIHSLEVTGYRCAEPSTAAILEQIIQETTNRMNRLQQQESENEVQLQQIRGDIEEERARKELLEVQIENSNARSEMEGLGEAERLGAFLEKLGSLKDKDTGKDAKLSMETRIALWNVLRKQDALHEISNGDGNARFYYTPNDVNLSIETREGVVGA